MRGGNKVKNCIERHLLDRMKIFPNQPQQLISFNPTTTVNSHA